MFLSGKSNKNRSSFKTALDYAFSSVSEITSKFINTLTYTQLQDFFKNLLPKRKYIFDVDKVANFLQNLDSVALSLAFSYIIKSPLPQHTLAMWPARHSCYSSAFSYITHAKLKGHRTVGYIQI